MLSACLRAEEFLDDVRAVSGAADIASATEAALIQASVVYHRRITKEVQDGLLTEQEAQAARFTAVQLRFSFRGQRPAELNEAD